MKKNLEKKLLSLFKKNLKLNKKHMGRLEKNGDLLRSTYSNWDSLVHIKLLMDIEKTFNIKITSGNFTNFNSFQKIKKILKK
tara:strand:+ start:1626 stop:1871 length:246 start_codon:yes stop_codon:yes gene_type:complete